MKYEKTISRFARALPDDILDSNNKALKKYIVEICGKNLSIDNIFKRMPKISSFLRAMEEERRYRRGFPDNRVIKTERVCEWCSKIFLGWKAKICSQKCHNKKWKSKHPKAS